ncbi:MAG: chromosome segregation ATPase [Phycisphaerales bacterium]|jgi:chromosome segregation ATPase
MLYRTTPALFITGLSLACISGCGQDTDSAKVTEAANVIDVRHVEDVENSYADIIGLLDSVSSSASVGTTEAAATLLGAAKSGVASNKAQASQKVEFTAREMGVVVRATTAKWQRLDAQAKAASQITVADELADIAVLIEERRAERTTNEQAKAGFDAQVAELDTQIADFAAKASVQRDEAGTLRLRLSQVSASEAATLAERIREFTLRADELDRHASERQTARDQITPEAREASLNVEKIEMQLQLLDRQRAEAQAREQQAQEDARSARAAADTVASELRNLAAELTAFVDGDLMSAHDSVDSEISASQRSTQQGRTVTRQSSALTSAAALQARGILENRRASALEEVARVYQSIAASGVMPTATESVESFHTRALEAHEAASQAFTSAASALRGVRLVGREFRGTSDRLKEAADTLDRLAATPLGEIPDLSPAPAAEDAFGDDDFADDGATDDETPEGEPLNEI